MRKSELEVALDHHLHANQTRYNDAPSLGDYYKRLSPASPTKKMATMVKTEAPEKKPVRRRTKGALEEASNT
jgi:hypothetical protein